MASMKGVKHTEMISRAVFDVNVVPDFANQAFLVAGCGGSPLPTFTVPDGNVVLRRGNAEVRVSLTNSDSSECIDNRIDVGVATARTLGLINKRRYNVRFDSVDRSISFFRKPVSRTSIATRIGSTVVEINTNGDRTITHITDNEIHVSAIGVVLLGILKTQLLLKRGLVTKRVRLQAGTDIFVEPFIQVTPNTAKMLGLFEEDTPVAFNQISSVLRIHPGK
ncbi:hypothetical protein FE783_10185 [Paenibacillus mesophilus]|uniref:hypothetical protein n=1 Tax=Paenibacillus mesophilus TaxID=2582849 RepID=UPI00110EAAA0|nr:hypothetical protein [Paenibacillus mesophilus]TMV49935.1 hypothetical protein FE783_10185 [Paenibacillus mesophilus]